MELAGYLVALLGSVLLPGYVFLRSPGRPANQCFALLGLSGALYNGFSLWAARAPPGPERLYWIRLAYLGAFLLFPLVLRFPRDFFGPELARRRRGLEPFGWAVALGFSALALSGGFLDRLDAHGRATGGAGLMVWTVLIGAAFLHFCWSLQVAYRLDPHPSQRNRLLYLVLGAVLFALPAASDLVYRLGLDVGQPFPLAPLGSLGFLACLSVAIVKHRLLDIEVVIHRGLVLSLLAPALATVFVVVGELLEGLFAGRLPPDSPYPGILAALSVAALFGPLSELLSQLIEALVIREFKVAPRLRAFRRLPYLIGAQDVEGLRHLQDELGVIIARIEQGRRAVVTPSVAARGGEAGSRRARRKKKRRRKR